MNTSPLISFVIPIYNAELYLNKCINSILNSKSQDIEIVLIDDGSTDKSSEICDGYMKNNANVKVIHQINGGVALARNTGIKNAIGKYIFFIDNDDWIASEKIANLIRILKTTNVDIVINKYLITDGKKGSLGNSFIDKKFINGKPAVEVLNYFRKNRINIMAPWEYVVKKEVIIKNNLSFNSEQNGVDDSCFTPILFCNCRSFYLNDDVVYFWRLRSDSQGKTHSEHSYILKMISTIDLLGIYISKTNEKFKIDYIYFSIYKNVYSLLGQYYNYSKDDQIYLNKWYHENIVLIKKSIECSGSLHKIINVIFGTFNGIIFSYKLAVLKGNIYLLLYKSKINKYHE